MCCEIDDCEEPTTSKLLEPGSLSYIEDSYYSLRPNRKLISNLIIYKIRKINGQIKQLLIKNISNFLVPFT